MKKVNVLSESIDSFSKDTMGLKEKIGRSMVADSFEDYMSDCGWALDKNGSPIDFNAEESNSSSS